MAALLQRPLDRTRPGHPRLLDSATMPVIKALIRTELARGLKAHGTSPATGMSFTFTAPPEPLMPDATAPVSLGVPLGERGELRPHGRNRAAKRSYPLHPSGPPSLPRSIPARRWHTAQAAVVIPAAGCVNDPVGYLAADAPVIASLRHGATCAEAENINKPQELGMPHRHGWFKQSLDLLKREARLARALVELDSRHAVAPQICSRHGTSSGTLQAAAAGSRPAYRLPIPGGV